MHSFSMMLAMTVLLCLSQVGNISATQGNPQLSPELKQKIAKFYDVMIPQLPEDNYLRQGFELGKDFMTMPIAKIDGDKIKRFVMLLLNPGQMSKSVQSLSQDQRKQILSFYDEVIPQMPENNLLRTRFEQAREVMSHPNDFSEKEFSLTPEVGKKCLNFFNNAIPKVPEENMFHLEFEIWRDLMTQPDKLDGEKIKKFIQFFIVPQKIRENMQTLTPEVQKEFLNFLNDVIPQIPEKNVFRKNFVRSRDLLKSVIGNSNQ